LRRSAAMSAMPNVMRAPHVVCWFAASDGY
jgi:hypothetical protein